MDCPLFFQDTITFIIQTMFYEKDLYNILLFPGYSLLIFCSVNFKLFVQMEL